MKYCGNCRHQVQDNATYCPRCGVGLVQQQASQYQYQSQQQPATQPQQTYQRQQPQQQPQQSSGVFQQSCPRCGAPLRYIAEYTTYYCDRCMEYQKTTGPPPQTQQQAPARPEGPAQPSQPESVPTSPDDSGRQEEVEPESRPKPKADVEEPEDDAEIDVDSMIGEVDEKVLSKKISKALKQIKKISAELKEKGHDTSELEELSLQCGNVFAVDDLFTATHYLERIQDLITSIKEREVDKVEADDVKADSIGDDFTEESISDFESDVISIEDEDIDDDLGVGVDKRVEELGLEEKPEVGDKEKAIQALESAKRAITDADGDGYDITSAKLLFQKARPLYESGKYSSVVESAREVEREVLRTKGLSEDEIKEILGEVAKVAVEPRIEEPDIDFDEDEGEGITNEERRELIGLINKVWIPLREASRYGLDISGFEDLLEQAKNKKSFHQARVLVDSVETEVKAKLSNYKTEQHDKASNMFHYIRSEIHSAEKLGVDVQPFQVMLDSASTGISLGNYEEAIGTMEGCLEDVKSASKAASAKAQTQVSAAAASSRSEAVWEPDEMDEPQVEDESVSDASEPVPEPIEKEQGSDKEALTDERRLKILEDRFILGEISEETYRDLKNSILERMGRR